MTNRVDYPAILAPHVSEVVRRQNDAIDAACWDALLYGCTVHIKPHEIQIHSVGDRVIATAYASIWLEPGPVQIVWHSMWEEEQ